MGLFVMLQIVDDRVETGVEHFTGARFPRRHLHAIHGGNGVRHDEHVRIPARGGSRATGNHGFLVGLARIAEVDVGIFESRGDGHGRSVHRFISVRWDDQVDDFAGVPNLDVVKGEGHGSELRFLVTVVAAVFLTVGMHQVVHCTNVSQKR